MNKQFIASLCVLAVVGMAVGVGVQGADNDSVECTVTPELIALTVTDGEVTYGTLGLNEEENTKNLGENQTVANTGNVNEQIQVKTSNAIGGTQWTVGTVGTQDVFEHYWSADPDEGTPTWTVWTVADAYATLNTSLPHTTGNTQLLGLKIHTPTAITDRTQKSITITVLATKAGA